MRWFVLSELAFGDGRRGGGGLGDWVEGRPRMTTTKREW